MDGFSRPWPNPGIAGRHYAEEEFVRGVSRGELLRARAPSEMTDGNENGVPAKCRHEKHDRPARLLRPRETQGRIPVAIGSPLFWRGCEALEILLTRIFAEQYYKTRDGSSHRGKRLSGDPLLRSGERRAPPAPPPGRRRSGLLRIEWPAGLREGSRGSTNITARPLPRGTKQSDMPQARANFFGVEIGGVPL